MKKFSELIQKVQINEAKFTEEELRNDYENASYLTGQEKKDMITKYSVTTKKNTRY